MIDFAAARLAMVENQLRPSRIVHQRLLAAMAEIPRESFVPSRLRGVAYQDEDIDLGDRQWLIEPLALAKLVQALDPDPDAAALVVGCATGYSTAVLSRLTGTVFHLCPSDEAGKRAAKNLDSTHCDNAIVRSGDLAEGLREQAPFGTILIAGAIDEIPSKLTDQLEDRGRLAAVVRSGRAGHVVVAERVGDVVGQRVVADAAIPPLLEMKTAEAFEF